MALPDDTTFEFAPPCKPGDDLDLQDARQRIDDMQDEIKRLHGVPVPSADIRERIEAYVSALARPKVSGIATGELRVSWPNDMIAVMALLQPDAMADALMKEVAPHANSPMSLPERRKRVEELKFQVDILQRRALALGADASTLPPAVVLGVKVVRRESQPKRVA